MLRVCLNSSIPRGNPIVGSVYPVRSYTSKNGTQKIVEKGITLTYYPVPEHLLAFREEDLDYFDQDPPEGLSTVYHKVVYRQHRLNPVEHLKINGVLYGKRRDGQPWSNETSDAKETYINATGAASVNTYSEVAFCSSPIYYPVKDSRSIQALYCSISGASGECWEARANIGRRDNTSLYILGHKLIPTTTGYKIASKHIQITVSKQTAKEIISSGAYINYFHFTDADFKSQSQFSNIAVTPANTVPILGRNYFRYRQVPDIWHELCGEAISSMSSSWDGNGIALVSDLREMRSAALSTAESIKSFHGPKKLKAAASVFLSFHYGWKLLASDLNELNRSLKRKLGDGFDHCTASRTLSVETGYYRGSLNMTYEVYYNRFEGLISELDKFSQFADTFDLKLTLGNVWDMIPYSFVVDWLVGIGDALSAIDSFYTAAYHVKTICGGRSIKYNLTLADTELGFINISYYRRGYGSIVSPIPPLETHSPTTSIANHWIEGGSLIVSR